ncbi:6-phosphogluconolactonase [Robbsia sp. KACC 23696]|uniref:6-phosphogluconolactonase n=1 Tax=Robbsia sp. KACC 23696 TaxID=3149231 RepID=UPI00325BC9EE
MLYLKTFDDGDAQAEALSVAVADALRAVLAQRGPQGRATLAVSGGKSPARFFAHLAKTPLAWSQIDITLVDDRWVPAGDEASNAGLLQQTLLRDAAAAARFLPIVDTTRTPEAMLALLNGASGIAAPDVAILGMGEDGHTASLFADAPQWGYATTTRDRFVYTEPSSAPHARISLSLHALRRVPVTFLQISGATKRAVLESAAAAPQRTAISRLANDGGVKLDAYWYA